MPTLTYRAKNPCTSNEECSESVEKIVNIEFDDEENKITLEFKIIFSY